MSTHAFASQNIEILGRMLLQEPWQLYCPRPKIQRSWQSKYVISYDRRRVFRESTLNLRRHVSVSRKRASTPQPVFSGSNAFEPVRTGCRALVELFWGKIQETTYCHRTCMG